MRGPPQEAPSFLSEELVMMEPTQVRQKKERMWKGHPKKDCGDECGCGSDGPTAQVRFDIKPKDPPVFTGKSFDDIEVGVQ